MMSIRKQATALLLTGPLAMLGPSACAAGLKQDASDVGAVLRHGKGECVVPSNAF